MDETTTRLLFHQVSAEAPPAAGVDLGTVVRRAERKRRRHRRWVATAAAVTVLVLTSAVAVLAVGSRETPPVRPAGPQLTYGPPITTAPTEFDPVRHAIELDWLPDGLPYVTEGVNRTEASYLATHTDGQPEYWLRLAARGHGFTLESWILGRSDTTSVPGPDIGGRPSRFYTGGGKRHELRWEWAPGATGSLILDDRPDALDVAVRIAESAHLTATPLRLPYTIVVPPSFRVSQAGTYWRRDELRTYSVDFTDRTTGSILGIGTASNTMTLDFEPNTVIANRPGQTKLDGKFARVRIRQPTVQFELSCNDTASITTATARCRAAAESIRLVADPLNHQAWPRAAVR